MTTSGSVSEVRTEPVDTAQDVASGTWLLTLPLFGLGAAVIGTFLAISLVPDNVEDPMALRPAAAVMALGLLTVHFRMMLLSPVSLFHPVAVVAASPVYWLLLDPIQGAYGIATADANHVRVAFLSIGLFSSCVWLAACFRACKIPWFVKGAAAVPIGPRTLLLMGLIAFAMAFLRFAIPSGFDFAAMIQAFSSGRWSAPWSRGAIGGWSSFLDHMAYFGYVVPPIAAIFVRRVGLLDRRSLVLIVCSLILIALFSTGGGRRIVGVLAGSGLVVWFLSAQKPRAKDLVMLGLGFLFLLGFLQMMLIYRGVGIAAAFHEETRLESNVERLHVDDNFLRLAQTIRIFPDEHPRLSTQWLIYVAVRPVPRVIWPGKPVDPGFDLAQFQGLRGVSLSTSLVGELYSAFGLFGCALGGLFMGIIANMLAQIIRLSREPGALIILGAGLLALFAGMRSALDLVVMSYGVLAWIGLVLAYWTLLGEKNESPPRQPRM